MSDRKYALHPGRVLSKTDNEWHYISAHELAQLYNLNHSQCIIWDDFPCSRNWDDYIHLFPRYHGDYISSLRELLEEE